MSRRFTFLFLVGICFACAHTDPIDVLHEGPPIETQLIAVGTVEVHLAQTKPWHHYEKIHDLLNALNSLKRIDAMAPWEYHVIAPVSCPGELLTQSDLAVKAKSFGVQVENILVINARITEETQDQLTVASKHDFKARARSFKSTVSLELELTHPAGNRVIAIFSDKRKEDRFANVPDYDHRPTASSLFRSSIKSFFTELLKRGVILATAPPLPLRGGLKLRENPAPVLTYKHLGRSLRDRLKSLDSLTREAQLYTRFRYFNPHMTLLELRGWKTLPPGLSVKEDTRGNLTGKHIVCINEKAVAHIFQWNRLHRRNAVKTITYIAKTGREQLIPATGKRKVAQPSGCTQ
jgi:hypothetical protein